MVNRLKRESAAAARTALPAMGRHELLSQEEELLLARRIQAWCQIAGDFAIPVENPREHKASEVLREIDINNISPEQMAIFRDALKAREELCRRNQRLVTSIARTCSEAVSLLTWEDRASFGQMGLIRAAEKFKPSKGTRFSTYATAWIKQGIYRGVNSAATSITMPHNVLEKRRRQEVLKSQLGRELTDDEMQTIWGKGAQAKAHKANTVRFVKSLDYRLTSDQGDEGSTLADCLGDERQDRIALSEEMQDLISLLGPQKRRIIQLYYLEWNPKTGKPHTQDTISRTLGISRNAVGRERKEALKQLKTALKVKA